MDLRLPKEIVVRIGQFILFKSYTPLTVNLLPSFFIS